jgi:hypothetical protein
MTDTERITNEVYDRFLDPDESPLYAPAEEYEDPTAPAIGIRNGLILSILFWLGLVLVAILLIRGCK